MKTIIFILLLSVNAWCLESDISNKFCDRVKGEREVVLDDYTRPDCLTKTVAWEVEYAYKWYESVGQSLHYARITKRTPGIALIVVTNQDRINLERLYKLRNYVKYPKIRVVPIDLDGNVIE